MLMQGHDVVTEGREINIYEMTVTASQSTSSKGNKKKENNPAN